MKIDKDIFLGKKILIYGLGKSGISTFKFLKKRADVYLFDDNQKTNLKIITINQVIKTKFDIIIISPGINILNCKLSKFLNKNLDKIYTDLDVFYSFYKNTSIAITGTNGKSTTAKILFDIFPFIFPSTDMILLFVFLNERLHTKVAALFFFFSNFLKMNFIALKKPPCFLANLAE